MLLNRACYIIIFLLLILFQSRASHIVGGEMSLTHIAGARYQLSLLLYFDGINGQDVVEDSILISSFSKSTNQRIENFFLTSSLNYSNPQLSNNLCKNGLNIRIYTYSSQIFLDENLYRSPQGYYLSWQRCCRANNVSNMLNSGTTGFAFYSEFPQLDLYSGNNSPQFKKISGDYYCIGEQTQIDFGASDADGDELVFSLVSPLAGFSDEFNKVVTGVPGPYPNVNGYSPLPSLNGLQINSEGILSFEPTFSGLFAISVKCEEFRNGVKLGEVRREFLILIRNCPVNGAPEISFFPFGGETEYQINDTIQIKTRNDLCHTIEISDPDPGSNLYYWVDLLDFPIEPPSNPSSGNRRFNICLPSCEDPEFNFFTIRFLVRDDFCPVPAIDFVDVNFRILESEDVPPEIATDFISEDFKLNDLIEFKLFAVDPDSLGLDIKIDGSGFIPSDLEMNFSITNSDCCNAEGQFQWKPECTNILDLEIYGLTFIAEGLNCGTVGRDSLHLEIFVETPDLNPFELMRMPNVLTANGDGLNDVFRLPELTDTPCFDNEFKLFEIYNRWGRKVFESRESNFQWSPAQMPAGDYFYNLILKDGSYKGFIHLLK